MTEQTIEVSCLSVASSLLNFECILQPMLKLFSVVGGISQKCGR
jgi:hypothetical protein